LGLNHGADRPAPHNPFRVAPSVQYVPIVHFYDDAYVDPTLVEDGLPFAPAEGGTPWWCFFNFLSIPEFLRFIRARKPMKHFLFAEGKTSHNNIV
jgi:hypothetical protein